MGVRVLRDVSHSQVVLGLSQFLSDFKIEVILSTSVCCSVELFTHLRLSVLLGAPHEGVLLSRYLKYIRVKAVNNWVADFCLFVDFLLAMISQLVGGAIRCQELS